MIRKNIVLTQNYNPVLVFPLKHGQPHSTQTSQNLLPQNYCFKAYLQNLIYDQNIKNFQSICRQIDQLKNSIQLRKNKHSISHHPIKQKSRIRRTADMIQKKYKCNEKNCYRSYGCQVSLKLHKKLKHSLSPATDKQNQIPDCQQKITSKISTVWCTESSNLD